MFYHTAYVILSCCHVIPPLPQRLICSSQTLPHLTLSTYRVLPGPTQSVGRQGSRQIDRVEPGRTNCFPCCSWTSYLLPSIDKEVGCGTTCVSGITGYNEISSFYRWSTYGRMNWDKKTPSFTPTKLTFFYQYQISKKNQS